MSCSCRDWDPFSVFGLDGLDFNSHNGRYAVVVLNTLITLDRNMLLPLWNSATIRMTVDGGTNRLYSWQVSNSISDSEMKQPEYITGDMDSASPNVLSHFTGVSKVIYTLDQNQTDFTKSLAQLDIVCREKNLEVDHVAVIADSSGRLDHIMGNINTLYKAQSLYPNRNVYLFGNDSISWLLQKGDHKISIPDYLRQNSAWCGLIPVGQHCKNITTTGLKWNLQSSKMAFGELVSTSNTYNGEPIVTIKTSEPILWCMRANFLTNEKT